MFNFAHQIKVGIIKVGFELECPCCDGKQFLCCEKDILLNLSDRNAYYCRVLSFARILPTVMRKIWWRMGTD